MNIQKDDIRANAEAAGNSEDSNIINIENMSFWYNADEDDDDENKMSEPLKAIDKVSLSIRRGSFTAVLGQNGSGKSTLAKNINALLLPSEGVVYVNGIDTKNEERLWDIRMNVGMVFQNPDNQLVSSIVEDDVAFGPENIGLPSDEIRKRVDEAMKSVGIYEQREKGPHLLSGGQKQRVAIAGVVAMKPECIVFDEPTAMLDPQGRKEVLNIIKKLNNEGITIVLITHFMEEAAEADRIVIMEEGLVKMDGTPSEVFSNTEDMKSLGLDVPPALEIRDRLKAKGYDIPDSIVNAGQLADYLCGLIADK